jgi:hypothetical protein
MVCAACVLQAMIMTDPADKLDPMSLLFYMSSFSVVLLLPTTLILEPGVFGEVSSLLLLAGRVMRGCYQHHLLPPPPTCSRYYSVFSGAAGAQCAYHSSDVQRGGRDCFADQYVWLCMPVSTACRCYKCCRPSLDSSGRC